MMRLHGLLLGAAVMCVLQMSAGAQEKKNDDPKDQAKVQPCCPPGHTFRHLDGRPIVFVANGVGGSTTVSDNLLELNSDRNLGLRIQSVPWCRQNALFQDLLDNQAQLHAAARIACTVETIRKDCPNVPIYLIGHSAGARVVLVAAEMLPPNTVERVIVLAPAVSCGYDLTGVLRASRGGIDNFFSAEDGVLDAAVYYHTLADGTRDQAAGRVGFRPMSADKKDLEAYRLVRQYRWNEEYHGSGGHFAWTLRHNMKKTIVPLLFMGTPIIEPPLATSPKMPAAK